MEEVVGHNHILPRSWAMMEGRVGEVEAVTFHSHMEEVVGRNHILHRRQGKPPPSQSTQIGATVSS